MSTNPVLKKTISKEFNRQFRTALQDCPFVVYALLIGNPKYAEIASKTEKGQEIVDMNDKVIISEIVRRKIDEDLVLQIEMHFRMCFRNFERDVIMAEGEGSALMSAGESFGECLRHPMG